MEANNQEPINIALMFADLEDPEEIARDITSPMPPVEPSDIGPVAVVLDQALGGRPDVAVRNHYDLTRQNFVRLHWPNSSVQRE